MNMPTGKTLTYNPAARFLEVEDIINGDKDRGTDNEVKILCFWNQMIIISACSRGEVKASRTSSHIFSQQRVFKKKNTKN